MFKTYFLDKTGGGNRGSPLTPHAFVALNAFVAPQLPLWGKITDRFMME